MNAKMYSLFHLVIIKLDMVVDAGDVKILESII